MAKGMNATTNYKKVNMFVSRIEFQTKSLSKVTPSGVLYICPLAL